MVDIIMPRRQGLVTPHANVSLEKRGEQFRKHEIQSYLLVTVDKDGRVNVDFDLKELTSNRIGAVGQGVYMAYEHLAKMQEETLRNEQQLGGDFAKVRDRLDETKDFIGKSDFGDK